MKLGEQDCKSMLDFTIDVLASEREFCFILHGLLEIQ